MKQKRIPEKVFVEWHSTGTGKHEIIPMFNGKEGICRTCDVRLSVWDTYGCQGMRFKEWYEKRAKK